MKRYPVGKITPHGAWHLRRGRIPNMQLTAHDGTIRFDLMGGKSIPHRTAPESVQIKKDGIKGLIPPWDTIDQKGATQDGVTFLDALYGPTEVELKTAVVGRDPQHMRRVARDLIASIDVKQPAKLSFFDHDAGHWWADLRWFKTPADINSLGESRRQDLTLVLRADNGFWRSHLDVSQFRFGYDDAPDDFKQSGAITGWDVTYSGAGTGHLESDGTQLVWVGVSGERSAVLRRTSAATLTDNQVIELAIGGFTGWRFPDETQVQAWGRMAETGTPGQDGICLTIESGTIRLAYWAAGVETVLRERNLVVPPVKGETFTLVCGYPDDPRLYKVLRNGLPVLTVKEDGTGSLLGPGFRGRGLGLHADTAGPAGIVSWSGGDNTTISQSGFVECLNIGDQPQYREYTLFGPGIFRIGNGPSSTDMVEFGPLLPNQVVYLRTDPRRRAVVDLTSVPPTPQSLDDFQKAIKDFISFATANNAPPLLQEIQSRFGIRPPQGNLYSLFKGRFSTDSAVPAKPAGGPARPYHIKVEIEGGNADSKIVCAGTPLRRWPV